MLFGRSRRDSTLNTHRPRRSFKQKVRQGGGALLPVDDLFALGTDKVVSLRGEDAQGVLLSGATLSVHHVRTLVHVDGSLGQGAGLGGEGTHQGQAGSIRKLKVFSFYQQVSVIIHYN